MDLICSPTCRTGYISLLASHVNGILLRIYQTVSLRDSLHLEPSLSICHSLLVNALSLSLICFLCFNFFPSYPATSKPFFLTPSLQQSCWERRGRVISSWQSRYFDWICKSILFSLLCFGKSSFSDKASHLTAYCQKNNRLQSEPSWSWFRWTYSLWQHM